MYEIVPADECWRETGKGPIGSMWLDIDKGGPGCPEYRSRFVAKEINHSSSEDMSAATPPLEAKHLVFYLAASQPEPHGPDPLKLCFIVVKRAFSYAPAKRAVFVKLPPEQQKPGYCGRLRKAMYGTRDAPSLWEAHYAGVLAKEGFVQGLSTPCVFTHSTLNPRLVVHGDDFPSWEIVPASAVPQTACVVTLT